MRVFGLRSSRILGPALVAWLVASPLAAAAEDDEFERGLAAARSGDHTTALEILTPLAEEGHALAQYAMGEMHSLGLGVPADDEIAFNWMLLAAEQGLVQAQLVIANGYLRGVGVVQDITEGLRWMRIVADKGVAEAQYMVGLSYEEGWHGVEQDDYVAARWYRRAAEQGYDAAELKLSNLYLDGRGVPHDPEQAEYWLRRSQGRE